MKKFTLLLILNLSFLIFNAPTSKAQYVYIPDASFAAWLNQYYPSCMNGSLMDTTCGQIVSTYTLDVHNSNISDLTGIKYFDNLIDLNCSLNQLTNLPELPNPLIKLNCSYNQLSNITLLPNSLQEFNCEAQGGIQPLNSLPILPNSLQILNCSFNYLSNLPTLPNSLKNLNCGHQSSLFTIPSLPNSLKSLDISALYFPVMPNTLENLICSEMNNLNLPPLPDSLRSLQCVGSGFVSLPTLPNNLFGLDCSYNQLTTLPTLPNSILYIRCENNNISYIPELPPSLTSLTCDNNQLTSLPTIPDSLQTIYCSHNQLTSLPVFPNIMQNFIVNNNNISCLQNLPIPFQGFGWYNISNNPFTCVPNQTSYSLGLPLCEANDVVNNPNNCPSVVNITGNVYTDMNSDCAYNNTDWNTENIPVKLYDNQNNFLALSYTINGVYSFAALQPDSFIIKINEVELPIDMACGQANNQTVHLDSTNQTISNINFPVVCDSTFDMEVHSVTRQGWVFPGQLHTVNTSLGNDVIWYHLNCSNTTYSGTVTLNVSGPVAYVTPVVGALTPQVSGNTFIYTIANFDSLTPASFGLKLLTDTTAQAGNQICVHVSIATTPLDADTSNNEYDFCYNVVNSYDPNMKEVYPTDVLPGYNDWFTYTIHFQNTGTAPAFNIRLRDTLDTQLALNTFEYLGASHTATTSLNGRMLSVRFNNIMLPDSTTYHDGSMGYYQYRIKPKANMLAGTNIKNTAYIYFDYNPAIVTNTTENHFDILTSPTLALPKGEGSVTFYPNPSKVNFSYTNLPKNSIIIIYNVIGEVCLTHYASLPFGEVGGASLPKGVYYCKVNGSAVVKLIKE